MTRPLLKTLALRLFSLSLLVFSLASVSFATTAEVNPEKAALILEKVQSLQSASGDARLGLLLELSDLTTSTDLKAATGYADEAVDLARSLKNKNGEVDALNQLGYISLAQDAPQDALLFFRESNTLATEADYALGMAYAKNGFGILWGNLGDYAKALDSYEAAAKLFVDLKDAKGEAFVYNNTGSVYESMGINDKAIDAYLKAFTAYESLGLEEEMAVTANNLGSVNKVMGNFDKAMTYLEQAKTIHTALGYTREVATELNNMGDVYAAMGDPESAENSYNQALEIAEGLKDVVLSSDIRINIGYLYEQNQYLDEAIMVYNDALKGYESAQQMEGKVVALNNIGSVAYKKRDFQTALDYHLKAYEASSEAGYRDGLKVSLKQLASDYQALENYSEASHYLTLYTELLDTIQSEKTAEAFANSEVLFDTEQKTKEIEAQRAELEERIKERNRLLLISGIILVATLMVSVLLVWVARERKKSDRLLLNILPKKVANELKATGKTLPERFESCTVYFSDIANFTSTSEKLDPVFLISELNDIFTTFDAIMEKYGCERIKTIGDAYMAVCGLPVPVEDHALRMIKAAREILEALEARNAQSEVQWRIRIGINTGQIVGGVVGVKKYIYDVFGDTINTASRMESNSEPMRINISESTYLLVKDEFETTPRTPIEVKGKGLQSMYFIEGPMEAPLS